MAPSHPDLQARSPDESLDFAVYLLEAAEQLKYCIGLLEPNNSKEYKINTGLLTKALKLHASILRNMSDSFTLSILRRVLLETCLTLEYLLTVGEAHGYAAFVTGNAMRQRDLLNFSKGAAPELKQMSDLVIAEVKSRLKRDGLKLKDVPTKPLHPKSWHPNMTIDVMAHKLGLIGDQWYETSYSHDSEAVHPSWEDVVTHHLRPDENTGLLVTNPNTLRTTPTQVEEVVCWLFHVSTSYLHKYDRDNIARLKGIDHMHAELHRPINKLYRALTPDHSHAPAVDPD